MVCKNCNYDNLEGAKFCASCGGTLEEGNVYEPQVMNEQPKVNNVVSSDESLIFNKTAPIIMIVLSALCCNWIPMIFAILALVEGGKVEKYAQDGNYESAKMSLASAKKWMKITYIVFGILATISIIVGIIYGIMIGLAANTPYYYY